MTSEPEENIVPTEAAPSKEVAEAVNLTLIQLAEFQEIADRAKEVSHRISKLTPPPVAPEAPDA